MNFAEYVIQEFDGTLIEGPVVAEIGARECAYIKALEIKSIAQPLTRKKKGLDSSPISWPKPANPYYPWMR